jgi:two-component system, response regulator PdtaR
MNNKDYHLVVVDDDEVILTALRCVLEADGYTVTTFMSGMEVLEFCRGKNQFDLLIIDYDMPVMNGIATVKCIQEDRYCPFVLFTSYEDEELVLEASKYGAQTFLRKTMDLSVLLPQIYVAVVRAIHLYSVQNDFIKNREINVAVGMLAVEHGLTSDEAFNYMRNLARNERIKMRHFAERLIKKHTESLDRK